jgi:hypothetical protein
MPRRPEWSAVTIAGTTAKIDAKIGGITVKTDVQIGAAQKNKQKRARKKAQKKNNENHLSDGQEESGHGVIWLPTAKERSLATRPIGMVGSAAG